MPELGPAVEREARDRLGFAEADAFLTRLEQLYFDILEPLGQVYGGVTDPEKLASDLVLDALNAAAVRPVPLRLLDRRPAVHGSLVVEYQQEPRPDDRLERRRQAGQMVAERGEGR